MSDDLTCHPMYEDECNSTECNCEPTAQTYKVIVSLRERSINDITYSKVRSTKVSDSILVLSRSVETAKQFNLPVCEMIPIFNIFKLSMWVDE